MVLYNKTDKEAEISKHLENVYGLKALGTFFRAHCDTLHILDPRFIQ